MDLRQTELRSRSRLVLEDVPRPLLHDGPFIRFKRPWQRFVWRWSLFALLWGTTAGVLSVFGAYYYFSSGLPNIPSVGRYWPAILSELHTVDGVLAGEQYRERRKVVPYERIPKRLVQAFIAAEDASFFDHPGINIFGTLRAAFKTVLKKVIGIGSIQGGSSLTQQTAKSVLISAEGEEGREKSIKRKIREAILAHRLEKAMTKEEILFIYLNTIFLGHQAYGVQAAAENYFRKSASELSLSQMAILAGLPQAPSETTPYRYPERAKERRNYVLRQMLDKSMITKTEFEAAINEPVVAFAVENVFRDFAPYFTEEARRDVVSRYGEPALLSDGLRITTTMDSEKQRAAQEAILEGLFEVDKRQGYRGPVQRLKTDAERRQFLANSEKAMGDGPLQEGRYYVALVTSIDDDAQSADVQVGKHKGKLPLLGMRWARKVNPEGYYPGLMLSSVKSAVSVGDVIVVRRVAKKDLTDDREQWDKKLDAQVSEDLPLFRLEQEPELQGAIVSIDPQRQYLVAMVGGYDFDANEFNRAFQACRQPGSSFKPLVYAAALEQLNWSQATILVDSPIVTDDEEHGTRWKPENYGEDFKGDVLLRNAVTASMNIPAIKTFQAVGVKNMAAWSQRLGLSTPMNLDLSAALGSSCVRPYELANVYAIFNRLGEKRPTYFIRKVEDRYGRTLEDHTAYDDPWGSLQDRLAAGYARLFDPPDQVMSKESAFITTDLLRGVVLEGTGAPANALGKPAAGKTGTTNDSFDAWFAGYTKDLVTVVWVGYDKNVHPLGRFETGGRASLPIWLGYMKKALYGRPQSEFVPPEELELFKLSVDPKTGKLVRPGEKNAVALWFKKGTEPQEQAGEAKDDAMKDLWQ